MKQKRCCKYEPHYYSQRLKCKLDELRFTRTSIVEAPSGYGKTTAVRDFFETGIPQNTPVYWFAAMDETPDAGFRRFCYEIDKIDNHVGRHLLNIGLPNVATIGEVSDALRSLQCIEETYLVIDNCQLLLKNLMPSFFRALMEHGGDGLHIIIITQMLGQDIHMTVAGRGFLHITISDLRLDADNIRSYYALSDVSITIEEAQSVEKYTEGWIIAVYLLLHSYRETGTISNITILPLMEHLVWDTLTREQQIFLMRLSPLETLTVKQACILIGCEILPTYAQDALKIQFIRYDIDGQRYELHSILLQLLVHKRKEQGADFEKDCMIHAGELCRDTGRELEALTFFWRIKDYERILTIDLSYLILEEIGHTLFSTMAKDIALNCPDDIKKKYLLSMLRIAWALFTYDFKDEFEVLMEDLREMIVLEGNGGTPALYGEWLLLSSFNNYPQWDKMIAILSQASEYFRGKCSQVILQTSPWWFGSCTPFVDFHFIPGDADKEGRILEQYIELFSKLTNGNGSGADVLYFAELAYHRGDIMEAEILAYKSVYLAESKKQSIIQLGAVLQLAQVALHKSDTEGWQHAINSMERAISYSIQNSFVVRSALDVMRGMLLVELQQLDGIADWLKNGEFTEKKLLHPMLPLALFVHTLYLLNKGEFSRVIGMIEAQLRKESIDTPFNNMLLTHNLVIGYLHMGNHDKAVELVRRSAQIALPDGLLFTFVSFSWMFKGLSDDIVKMEYPELYNKFKEIKERFGLGWTKIHNYTIPEELPEDLTKREREVAQLAADGLHNSEIADKLFISESTVRTHLRTIFKKLDIDRRMKLAEKLK